MLKRPVQLLSRRSLSLKPNLAKFKLKPQPAGGVIGGPNDPTPKPVYDEFHGAYHWSYERLIAVSLIPLATVPFVAGAEFPVADALLCSTILMHSHIGIGACITDYIPERVYGVWSKYASRLLTFGTCVAFYGIYEMETTDEGLTSLIMKLWEKKYIEPEPELAYYKPYGNY